MPAVNSALQRARATIAASAPEPHHARTAALTEAERRTLERFVDAWQRRDIPGLAALLHEDVVLAMPPQLTTIAGRDQVMHFLATVPADGHLDRIQLLSTRANGQPALAAYLPDETSRHHWYGVMVLSVADGGISTITGFPEALFDAFGLPATRD